MPALREVLIQDFVCFPRFGGFAVHIKVGCSRIAELLGIGRLGIQPQGQGPPCQECLFFFGLAIAKAFEPKGLGMHRGIRCRHFAQMGKRHFGPAQLVLRVGQHEAPFLRTRGIGRRYRSQRQQQLPGAARVIRLEQTIRPLQPGCIAALPLEHSRRKSEQVALCERCEFGLGVSAIELKIELRGLLSLSCQLECPRLIVQYIGIFSEPGVAQDREGRQSILHFQQSLALSQ